jgi:hypothetical protein
MGERTEDQTLKLGLLLETAQTQQGLAGQALERLREHTSGLDAIVREEIRHTLLEELQGLSDDSARAAASLRHLQHSSGARRLLWSSALLLPVLAVPLVGSWLLPSASQVAALSAQRDALNANIVRLAAQGGRLELRHCGTAQRLCVRVERRGPSYGEEGDFLVVKGY